MVLYTLEYWSIAV